jgi:hypothetical protein
MILKRTHVTVWTNFSYQQTSFNNQLLYRSECVTGKQCLYMTDIAWPRFAIAADRYTYDQCLIVALFMSNLYHTTRNHVLEILWLKLQHTEFCIYWDNEQWTSVRWIGLYTIIFVLVSGLYKYTAIYTNRTSIIFLILYKPNHRALVMCMLSQ